MRQSRIESGSAQRLCIFKKFIAQISKRRMFSSVEQFNLFCVFWPEGAHGELVIKLELVVLLLMGHHRTRVPVYFYFIFYIYL